MWPNFVGSELAPTTAKRGVEKNIRAAASVAIFDNDTISIPCLCDTLCIEISEVQCASRRRNDEVDLGKLIAGMLGEGSDK